jgi:uncharacterized repeat protein (TIGR01451 family)
MRRSLYASQFLAVAIGFFGALASIPALGQPATTLDAGVFRNQTEIVPAADGGSLDLITYGGTATYRVAIQNIGSSHAFTVKLTGTAPTGPTVTADGGLTTQITAVTPASCTISGDKASFTCNNLGDLIDGQLADGGFLAATTTFATFTIQLAAPSKPYTTTCSLADGGQLEGVLLGPATVTASANNAPNAPASVSSTRTRPLADLAVTMTGPDGANPGDTVNFQVHAANNGPCASNRVRLTNGNASAGFIFQSNTGACTSGYPCTVAQTWPAGASIDLTSTYKVDNVAFQITQTQLLNEVDLASNNTANPDGGSIPVVFATPDPSAANNSATTNTGVTHSVGCNSVGAGSTLALLAAAIAVGMVLKRRRRD